MPAKNKSKKNRGLLSVVIPAFNEQTRLPPTLLAISAHLRAQRRAHEIIVVDDGSSDATVARAKALARRVPGLKVLCQPRNLGKGAAVRAGVLAAKGVRVLFSDADLSTPIAELESLDCALDQGADVAIGSRALDRSRIAKHQPFYRELGGRAFNLAVRLLTVHGFHDTQCGFKLFTRSAGQAVFALQRIPGFGFDVEVLYLAQKLSLKIKEVAVRWENSPDSKVRPIRDGLGTFLDLVKIRLQDWGGAYKSLKTRRIV